MNCPHCGKEIPVDFVDPKAVQAAQEKLLRDRESIASTGCPQPITTGFSTANIKDLAEKAGKPRE